MRVLGIDPGTGRCGFGIVEKHGNRIVPINYGVIETFKEQNSLERLNIVYVPSAFHGSGIALF